MIQPIGVLQSSATKSKSTYVFKSFCKTTQEVRHIEEIVFNRILHMPGILRNDCLLWGLLKRAQTMVFDGQAFCKSPMTT